MTTNLLQNAGFEDGYYKWNGVPELTIPNGWEFWHANQSTPWIDRQGQNWDTPEAVVWNIADAPQEERSLFFIDGRYTLKVFGGWKAIWFKLTQQVTSAPVGQRLRLTVPVFPDLVSEYGDKGKLWAPDPLSGEVRLSITQGETALADSGYLTGNTVRYGQMNFLTLEFNAPSPPFTVNIECRGRWGIVNNGWFIDRPTLEPTGEAATSTTAPTASVARPAPAVTPPTPQPATPPQPVGGNLLRNPGFEDGYYHHEGHPEMAIPNEWQYWYANNSTPWIERQDQNWDPPEMVVWHIAGAPEDEKKLFFLDGSYCLKGFGGWKAIWFKLSQSVTGLTNGATYRFTTPIYPDLVVEYGEQGKIFASDPIAGEVRLQALVDGQPIGDTGWLDGGKLHFGQMNHVTLEFTATAAEVTVSVECRGRWGLVNNGWFLDSFKLEQLSTPTATPKSGPGRLTNADFSGQVYQVHAQLPRLLAPEGWSFWYAPRTTEKLPGQTEKFREPNAYVATPKNALPDDMDAFVEGVSRVYAVIGPWRAIWWALGQSVAGLTPGKRYRLSARLYPDPVAHYTTDEKKTFDTTPLAGEIWLRADSGGQRSETAFIVNRDLHPGRYATLVHEFVASSGDTTVSLMVRSRKALVQNAWYVAAITLDPA